MKKQKPMGLLLGGSLRAEGVTFYLKQGKMIARSSRSSERRSCTRSQFVQRMKMKHATALWQMLKDCQQASGAADIGYYRFKSLALVLPAVYLPQNEQLDGASFLMDGIPVSEGSLPAVGLTLGEAGDSPALLTDLRPGDLQRGETLRLYTAAQLIEGDGTPRVRFMKTRDLTAAEMTSVGGRLALVGEEFADQMRGWALVRVLNGADDTRCSTQTIATHCTLWQQYATEEALQKAARSYGGLTDKA